MSDPLSLIQGQIDAARSELKSYAPAGIDWYGRCSKTAGDIIPWLCKLAPDLLGFCEEVYNSPDKVRALWEQCKNQNSLGQLADQIDLQLAREQVLIKEIAGDVVSRVMTDFMLSDTIGKRLSANGKSDYPDLYFSDYDYSQVPKFDRQKKKEYGAAVKGASGKPVRIPDGLEIKTCRNTFRVDCHYNHMGLHVALFYTENNGRAKMCDLLAAFLRQCDYKLATRNTEATTAKASFGPKQFVSLTSDGSNIGGVKGLDSTNPLFSP